MKYSTAYSTTLILVFSTIAFAAQANSGSALAKITDLSFQTFDISPSDGLSPSYQILPNQGFSSIQFDSGYDSYTGNTVYATLADNEISNATNFGKIDSSSLESRVTGSGTRYFHDSQALVSTFGFDHYNLRIAPKSGIVLSANTYLSTQATCTDPVPPFSFDTCSSTAKVTLELSRLYDNGHSNSSYFYKEVGSYQPSGFFSENISLSYTNTTNDFQDIRLNLLAGVSVRSNNSVVPEPSAYLLLGAGLAVMAWRRRIKPS